MKKNERFWCWWLHRYIYFQMELPEHMYYFEDIADVGFTLTKDQVDQLEKK